MKNKKMFLSILFITFILLVGVAAVSATSANDTSKSVKKVDVKKVDKTQISKKKYKQKLLIKQKQPVVIVKMLKTIKNYYLQQMQLKDIKVQPVIL